MNPFFRNVTGMASGAWPFLLTMGICSVLFGLLVIIVPWLLIYLIGSLFLLAGFFLISMSVQMRRQNRDAKNVFEDFQRRMFNE